MNQLAEKVRSVEAEIAKEKGSLNLFALFERDDLPGQWDVVISASWADKGTETLRYVASVLKRQLTPSEMSSLARIVVLPADEDPVRSITKVYDVEHGCEEMLAPARFGLSPVRWGYIITSRRAA